MSAQVELWRVSTAEGVFEADLETLKQWITEGAVLPTDKVSKGTLRWIEAGRAPMLKAAFSSEPGITTVASPTPVSPLDITPLTEADAHTSNAEPHRAPKPTAVPSGTDCHNHNGVSPDYVCRMCGELFCRECARVVQRITLCPLCGDLCKPYEQVKAQAVIVQFQTSGFGVDDFARAIRYPFQHKVALLCGALAYAFLLLGGFRTGLIAYVIMFGCMSHVISQVAWGRLNRSFMPDFSEFSMWDDLIQPLFLGLGITIVSWGPTIVLIVAILFGVLTSAARVSPLGNPELAPAEQSGPSTEDLSALTDPNADPNKVAEANKKLNEIRPGGQISRDAERTKHKDDPGAGLQMLLPYLGAGLALAGLLLIFIAWGIFYYPMALAVAGYTQSFGSVINPLVGLDTIKRMGATYFKAFGMVLVIQAVTLVISVAVAFVTSPLALPFVGNLPARFIDGTITFYANLVIACVLGLSLYKCADRLAINVD